VKTATPATEALAAAGIAHRVHRYGHEATAASYGTEAADALDAEASQVFKTLIVAADGNLVVAVVPITSTLDVKALARAVGAKKAEMVDTATAERSTGYVVGGISPIGQRRSLPTIIDQSAADWATVFVSGGRRGLEVELDPADLCDATNGRFAAIGRGR
jgi:Cys-tRNA(Pro)/Cys-tRNA(Cys) deacylase